MLSIRPVDNTVVVGPRRAARCRRGARRPAGVDGRAAPERPFDCDVQLRAHGMVSAGRGDGSRATTVTAALADPQRGVAAGQALVMYDGDTVLGSATITAARRVRSG